MGPTMGDRDPNPEDEDRLADFYPHTTRHLGRPSQRLAATRPANPRPLELDRSVIDSLAGYVCPRGRLTGPPSGLLRAVRAQATTRGCGCGWCSWPMTATRARSSSQSATPDTLVNNELQRRFLRRPRRRRSSRTQHRPRLRANASVSVLHRSEYCPATWPNI